MSLSRIGRSGLVGLCLAVLITVPARLEAAEICTVVGELNERITEPSMVEVHRHSHDIFAYEINTHTTRIPLYYKRSKLRRAPRVTVSGILVRRDGGRRYLMPRARARVRNSKAPDRVGCLGFENSAPTSAAGVSAQTQAIPVPLLLSSKPGKTAKLFLNFGGRYVANWGGLIPGNTKPYDTDGNLSSFSAGELTQMTEIWKRVAEAYSPFNINVTTVDPGNLENRVTAEILIGGSSSDWYGPAAGGAAYIGGFYNFASNTGFVFEDMLANGNIMYTADAAVHEAGHLFGLNHQASWSGNTLAAAYNQGDVNAAPHMGVTYYSSCGLWWHGPTSYGPASLQDDLAILSGASNNFGYDLDMVGGSHLSATALTADGAGQVSGRGIIEQLADIDSFSFTTTGGPATLSVQPVATTILIGAPDIGRPMLDVSIKLLNSSGTVLHTASGTGLGEAFSAINLAAGTYFLTVEGEGKTNRYTTLRRGADIGGYTLTGTIATAGFPTATHTAVPSATPTPSNTPTAANTPVPSVTPTTVATPTRTNTSIPSPTHTPGSSLTPTRTATPTATRTHTATYSPAFTPTSIPADSATPTATPVIAVSATPAATPQTPPEPPGAAPTGGPERVAAPCPEIDGDKSRSDWITVSAPTAGQRSSPASLVTKFLSGSDSFLSTPYHQAGAIPVFADYSGDGYTEEAYASRNSTRKRLVWSVKDSRAGTAASFRFGSSRDTVVWGCDFDGDKRSDPALLTAGNTLKFRHPDGSITQTKLAPLRLGKIHQIACGDIDGDGKDELGLSTAVTSASSGSRARTGRTQRRLGRTNRASAPHKLALINPLKGTLIGQSTINNPIYLSLFDIDYDGRAEALWISQENNALILSYLLGGQPQRFTLTGKTLLGVSEGLYRSLSSGRTAGGVLILTDGPKRLYQILLDPVPLQETLIADPESLTGQRLVSCRGAK